jgi:hypothetical protein
MDKYTEQAFVAKIRAELDARAADLDAHSLRRLRLARREALGQLTAARPRAPWYAAAALATLACALIGMNLWQERTVLDAAPEEISLLAGADAEVAEDLEFYEWLDKNQGVM